MHTSIFYLCRWSLRQQIRLAYESMAVWIFTPPVHAYVDVVLVTITLLFAVFRELVTAQNCGAWALMLPLYAGRSSTAGAW